MKPASQYHERDLQTSAADSDMLGRLCSLLDEVAFRALQELWDTRHQEFVYNWKAFFSDRLTDIFKSFDTLLSRPWLWRTRVLQEVGVSAHAVVVCGENFLSWDSFEASILSAESSSEFQEEDGMPFEKFSRVKLIRYIRSSQFQDCQEPSISQMLRSGNKNESTDPRDLVYALLGLCETSAPLLTTVNYSLSVQEVYKETVVACLSSSDPFTILSLTPTDGYSSLKLLSWAPDFSALPPKISGACSYIRAGCFRAGYFLAGSKPHFEGKSQDVLSAQGKIIGNISKRKIRPEFFEDSISEDGGLYFLPPAML